MAIDVNDMYDGIKAHVGHELECVSYGGGANVAVECVTCSTVLFDADHPAVMDETEARARHGEPDGDEQEPFCCHCGTHHEPAEDASCGCGCGSEPMGCPACRADGGPPVRYTINDRGEAVKVIARHYADMEDDFMFGDGDY